MPCKNCKDTAGRLAKDNLTGFYVYTSKRCAECGSEYVITKPKPVVDGCLKLVADGAFLSLLAIIVLILFS